jgi:hypothetical protein
MAVIERMESLRSLRLVLLTSPKNVSMKVQGALGEASLQEQIYRPILEILEGKFLETDFSLEHPTAAVSLNELELALSQSKSHITFPQLLQAITVLLGQGHLGFAQDVQTQQAVQARCDRLNLWIANRSREYGDIQFMASPVTGGGVVVSRFEQLFLLGKQQGIGPPKEQANWVWDLLKRQGQRLLKEGKAIESEADNIAELAQQAYQFAEDREARLKYLRISLG